MDPEGRVDMRHGLLEAPFKRWIDLVFTGSGYHSISMRLTTLLLRVLLCLSLVFNGAGYSFASGHLEAAAHTAMEHAAMTIEEGSTHRMAQAQPPCHDEDGTAATQPASLAPAATLAANTQDPDHSGVDCCQSGSCRCVCVHASVALMLPPAGGALAPMHDAAMQTLVTGAPAPALPHLIRPPIG